MGKGNGRGGRRREQEGKKQGGRGESGTWNHVNAIDSSRRRNCN